MRTQKEVKVEIEKLIKIKPSVGDNHQESIDAQVEVLTDLLDEDQIYNYFDGGEWSENVEDSAIEASMWFHEDEDIPPSENWKDLVK